MRIERKGVIVPLTPRVERYLRDSLGGKSLDGHQSSEKTRIDYSCLNGLLAVEVKTLAEDASERMENLVDELNQRDDWPIFYGSAPVSAVIMNMDDSEAVHRRVHERIGRAIRNHLKKANKQFEAHVKDFPRKNIMRLVVLINEDHEVYDPEVVGFTVQSALKQHFSNIDAVIFMTERHATQVNGRLSFPMLSIEGEPMAEAVWKETIIRRFMQGWANWNGNPLYTCPEVSAFSTIEHIPDQMPRHEFWRLSYRRNPYMKQLSNEELRNKFDDSILLSMLAFLKDSPVKLDQKIITSNMERFTHIICEMNQRGISMPAFRYVPDRIIAAAERIKSSAHVIEWLRKTDREKAEAAIQPA